MTRGGDKQNDARIKNLEKDLKTPALQKLVTQTKQQGSRQAIQSTGLHHDPPTRNKEHIPTTGQIPGMRGEQKEIDKPRHAGAHNITEMPIEKERKRE